MICTLVDDLWLFELFVRLRKLGMVGPFKVIEALQREVFGTDVGKGFRVLLFHCVYIMGMSGIFAPANL